ncbi:hypothetical protein HA49_14610 [Tatumella morbirosei]|uniref:Asp/Glu/hydantoin racemase n=1 Tax=Tatumella morbirosei TaxID=642227 RepID=A0A095T675_9GAMM|nr:aspartate/glutamate racemase family protein [Tatumella morbirosei]KGD72024.1 hypothetical protein HA49_14610 [Tatumella morbirosei]
MNIRIINPNSSKEFVNIINNSAQEIASVGTAISVVCPEQGVASVESHCDEAIASLGVISLVMNAKNDEIDGWVVACFGDTGVAQCRELTDKPVIGITEAALFSACMLGDSFSILTLPPRTIKHARRVVMEYGLSDKCRNIRGIDLSVVQCLDEQLVWSAFLEEGRRALQEDQCEVLVLGCAGLSQWAKPLQKELGIPVVDGVSTAIKFAEAFASLGLGISKSLTYAMPGNLNEVADAVRVKC